jgi:hypothetical protein
LVLVLGLAAGEPPPAATVADPAVAMRLLVVDLRPEGTDPGVAATLTTLVVQELDAHDDLEVLSGADLKEMAKLAEVRARLTDCEDDSCLVEMSAALGARYVVTGQVGALGTIHLLSLSLFDSDEGRVVNRERVALGPLEQAPERLAPHVNNLMAETLGWQIQPPAPELTPVATAAEDGGALGAVSTVLVAGGLAIVALSVVGGGLAYAVTIAGTALLNGLSVETAYSALPLLGPLVHIGARPDLNLQSRVVYYIAFGFQSAAVVAMTLGGAAAATGWWVAPADAE